MLRLTKLRETITGSLQHSQALFTPACSTKEPAKVQANAAYPVQPPQFEIDGIGIS